MTLGEVLESVPGCPRTVPVSNGCLSFFEKWAVPSSIISELTTASKRTALSVGQLTFAKVNDIPGENEEEQNRACIENGFLIIGHGLNGDPIAVEWARHKVSFISHDDLWEEDYDDFEECVVRTPLELVDFWKRAGAEPDFPVDCFDAEERWSKLWREATRPKRSRGSHVE